MDYQKLLYRYRQFGGIKLVWEYAKLGVLPTIITSFFRCLVKRQSFKAIYPAVLRKVEPVLVKRYSSIVQEFKSSRVQEFERVEHKRSRIIWFCWLQGLNEAPQIVKACYASLVQEFKRSRCSSNTTDSLSVQGYEIKVIDNSNWRDYIELPDYIVRKWEKKQIPAASFSDLLRLQLLIKYGGTWIDSTVLCTGVNDNHNENDNRGQLRSKSQDNLNNNHQESENLRINSASKNSDNSKLSTDSKLSTINSELKHKMLEYLDADLFLFQYTKPGCKWSGNVSTWFISAHSNNEVLMTVRDMLFAYWKDYDCLLDYYAIHLFFSMAAKAYPEQIAAMPYGYSSSSLTLLHHWGEKFDQEKWDRLTSKVSFHKLAFRVREKVKNDKENYYNYILGSLMG